MRIELCNTKELDRYLQERHYLKSTPPGAKLRMWVKDDAGNIIGAMMWGRPTARAYDYEKILELTRMFLQDETEHCAESKALGMARKIIRKELPRIKGLIAYSSTSQQHEGTIYLADGWFPLGLTAGGSWGSRPGRKDVDVCKKIRYVRSV